MTNNIYVQGSYIDIHDNENVFLSVDKGEVKVSGQHTAPTPSATRTEVPAVLECDRAKALHTRLVESGLTDEEWQPQGLSMAQKGLLASALAERLDIPHLWQTFAPLWGVKPDTLRVAWNKALEQPKSIEFQKKLNHILG